MPVAEAEKGTERKLDLKDLKSDIKAKLEKIRASQTEKKELPKSKGDELFDGLNLSDIAPEEQLKPVAVPSVPESPASPVTESAIPNAPEESFPAPEGTPAPAQEATSAPTPETPQAPEAEAKDKAELFKEFGKKYIQQMEDKILQEVNPSERGLIEKYLPKIADWWKKNWKKRLILGAVLVGAGTITGAWPTLAVSLLAYRVASNFVGTFLAHNATTAALDEARFLRKEKFAGGRRALVNSTLAASGTFFKNIFKKHDGGFIAGLKQTGKETSKAFTEANKLTETELNNELAAITDPQAKLDYLEEKLIRTYEIARRKGVKNVSEIGGQEITNLLLDKFKDTIPAAIEKVIGESDLSSEIKQSLQAGRPLSEADKSNVADLINDKLQLDNRFERLYAVAKKEEGKQAGWRFTRSFIVGLIGAGLTYSASAHHAPSREAAPGTAAAGAGAEHAEAGLAEPKEVINTCYGKAELSHSPDGKHHWVTIFNRDYESDPQGTAIKVGVDTNHDGLGDISKDKFENVKVRLSDGFGTYQDEKGLMHYIHADDKDLTGNAYGIVGREGQMVDVNHDGICDTQVWKDAQTGEWQASHMDTVLKPNVNASEFVYDDKTPVPPDYLKNIKIPEQYKEVFGNKFEFDHFIAAGKTPAEQAHDLAKQYEAFYHSPYEINQSRVDQLTDILTKQINAKAIDPTNVRPDQLKPLYEQANTLWEQAGKPGKYLWETAVNADFSSKSTEFIKNSLLRGHYDIIPTAEKNNIISLIKNWITKFSPEDNKLISNLISKDSATYWRDAAGRIAIVDAAANDINPEKGIGAFIIKR